MAKVFASETAKRAADQAVQIWGGEGFMNKNVVARHLRDCRILTLGEGSTEVQLAIIARALGFEKSFGA